MKKCRICGEEQIDKLFVGKGMYGNFICNLCKICKSNLVSEQSKKMIRTDEWKKNIGDGNRGHVYTEEQNKANSNRIKELYRSGKLISPFKKLHKTLEFKTKIKNGLKNSIKFKKHLDNLHLNRKGQVTTEITKEKQRRIQKIIWSDENKRKKQSEIIKKIRNTPEQKKLTSKLSKQMYINKPQLKIQCSIRFKKLRANPEKNKQILEKRSIFYQNNMTSIEKKIMSLLNELCIKYESQKIIGKYCVDFFLIDYNIIIECDGDYWHNLKHIIKRDKIKNEFFNNNDYKIIRIQEKQIKILTKEFFEFILDDVIMNNVAYSKW